MIEIDGSYGEGGGQILRTSLSLSCLLRLPFRLFDIRKGRRPPGLRPQHLMAVGAAREIAGADVRGAHLGSREIVFNPHSLTGGEYRFDIGTAGSTSLVLQTVIPPLLFAHKKSVVDLIGGTHVMFSPSFDYLQKIFVPMVHRLGCSIQLHMGNAGFYPRGGGTVRAEIWPLRQLLPLTLTDRGEIRSVTGISAVANLPEHIASRQIQAVQDRIARLGSTVDIKAVHFSSPGRGSSILLIPNAFPALAGFEGLGAPGKPAEAVGSEAANKFLEWFDSGMALDRYLADQLVIYLALSGKSSVFTTVEITRHLITNLWVTSRFHHYSYATEGEIGCAGKVTFNQSENVTH